MQYAFYTIPQKRFQGWEMLLSTWNNEQDHQFMPKIPNPLGFYGAMFKFVKPDILLTLL